MINMGIFSAAQNVSSSKISPTQFHRQTADPTIIRKKNPQGIQMKKDILFIGILNRANIPLRITSDTLHKFAMNY